MFAQLFTHPDVKKEPFSGSLVVSNPATGEVLAYVRPSDEVELSVKIQQAEIAQKKWVQLTALERADILWRWYHLVLAEKESLARLMTMEQGKPLRESRAEMDYAASFIRWYAEEARRCDGDILTPVKSTQRLLVLKQAVGVTAAITPWNFPAAMITRKAAPALAAGCAMLVKPASQTPLSAYALVVLAYQAGVPENVLMIVSGSGKKIGTQFCYNPIIRKISFTGSTEVGREIFKNSAQHIKKLSLELGGNAPFIVFNDADIEKAAQGLIASKFRNSGQTCVCTNRVYVQTEIYQSFCQRVSELASQLQVGNGLDESIQQGPLIDEQALIKVEEYLNDALNNGAQCLTGGKRSILGSTFFEPTVLSGVNHTMRLANEEIFGPICPIFQFDGEEEVIQMANNTDFGLAAYIFTNDCRRQWRVSEKLEYGMVGVNTGLISNEVAPFGGIKQSGIGREGSRCGIEEYLETKYLCLDIE